MSDIAGIDLGTTNSLIGIVEAGFPILLADEHGARLTPSAVYFPADGAEPEVGSTALRRAAVQPERTVVSVKRLIGRRAGELDHAPPYATVRDARGGVSVSMDGQTHSPVEVSAMILRRLKAVAERALERPVTRAVITVPAYFNDAQRTATRQAGELAGFTVERILNEPTAAALAYGLDKLGERSRVAIYDLGGGTFDISILELNEGIFHVLATHGDTALGGDDFDRALAAWLEGEVSASAGRDYRLGPQGIASAPAVVRIPDIVIPRHEKGMVAGMRLWLKSAQDALLERISNTAGSIKLDWGKLATFKPEENPLHHYQALSALPELYMESRVTCRHIDRKGSSDNIYERHYAWAMFPDGVLRHVLLTVRLCPGPAAPQGLYSLEALGLEIHEANFTCLSSPVHGTGYDTDQSAAGGAMAAFLSGIKPEHRPEVGSGMISAEARARLRAAAVELKHALSTQESAVVSLPFLRGAESFSRTVARAEFEQIAAPILERTRGHCLRALHDSGLTALDAVVLVGGSTRIPLVRRLAAEIFGREPDVSQHPDEAVALGAVIQAGILSGAMQKMVLLDVTPLSLGIETFGGLMNVIIPRNTTIPCRAGELFTNAVTNQPSMLIRVLQGEREMARDNWELGQLQLDFEPGPKGSARVGVQFEIDADGILRVLARDTKTQTDRVLDIRSSAVDVTDERVEEMIASSVEHAFDDMHERQWTTARLKAEELLAAVAAAMPVAGDAVPEAERAAIFRSEEKVRAALCAEDLTALKAANLALDASTETLAAVIVERAMEQALERRLG